MTAEPFTKYLAYDLLRVATIAGALILCALVVRLAVHRHRRRWTDPEIYARQTHPLTMWSYAVCLFFIAVRRADQLGEPWSWYMAPAIVILILGYCGVARRVRFTVAPPWRRHR
jgi:amino acid transporter